MFSKVLLFYWTFHVLHFFMFSGVPSVKPQLDHSQYAFIPVMTKYMWYQHLGTNLASNLVADKGKDLTFIYFSMVDFFIIWKKIYFLRVTDHETDGDTYFQHITFAHDKRASQHGFLLKNCVLLTNDLNIANDVIVVLPDVSN